MRFSKKNLTKGFTLTELLIVVALISIMTIWAMNMNFDISDREKLAMFDNEIMTQIEEVRDFALIWKWITDSWNLVIPDRWKVTLSPWFWANKWKVTSEYFLTNAWAWTIYKEYDVQDPFVIEKLTCRQLNNTDTYNDLPSVNDDVVLTFKWQDISVTSTNLDCQDEIKEVILGTDIQKLSQWKIIINRLSWVIQREKR